MIKGISTKVDFETIDPKEGSSSFPTLVGRPWGRKMKASISLDKERIELKGNGKKIIVPIHPSQGKPWIEPIDEDADIQTLCQIRTMKIILDLMHTENSISKILIRLDITQTL